MNVHGSSRKTRKAGHGAQAPPVVRHNTAEHGSVVVGGESVWHTESGEDGGGMDVTFLEGQQRSIHISNTPIQRSKVKIVRLEAFIF